MRGKDLSNYFKRFGKTHESNTYKLSLIVYFLPEVNDDDDDDDEANLSNKIQLLPL